MIFQDLLEIPLSWGSSSILVVEGFTLKEAHRRILFKKKKIEMVSGELVFGSSALLEVTATHSLDDQVILSVQCRKTQTVCSNCQVNSNQLHSCAKRKIKDFPAFTNKVCLQLRARKWNVDNGQGKQRIFTEGFGH